MQAESNLYDLSGLSGSNVQIVIGGKAVNGRELLRSLEPQKVSPQIYNISKEDRAAALRKARFQVYEAAMLGEDRLYRSGK